MSCARGCFHANTISHGSGQVLHARGCTHGFSPAFKAAGFGRLQRVADRATYGREGLPSGRLRRGLDIPVSHGVLFSVTEDIDE